MTTLDDAGNFHDRAGKSSGHRQGEANPALLGEPRRSGGSYLHELRQLAQAETARKGALVPTTEMVTKHVLESFLDRLTRTGHAKDFILKGGVLMGAYDVRRPTKDIDTNAVADTVSPERIAEVAREAAECEVDDGVVFEPDTIRVEQIREQGEYPGIRLHMRASVGGARAELAWDVSTGDPIVPPPRLVQIPRVIGDPIPMWSYAPETTVAEKAVTILERGTTSTRWRDYVDIVQLHREQQLNTKELRAAVRAVADYRQVKLRPIGEAVEGYGAIGQQKWANWRRRMKVEDICEAQLDDQMKLIAELLGPIFD